MSDQDPQTIGQVVSSIDDIQLPAVSDAQEAWLNVVEPLFNYRDSMGRVRTLTDKQQKALVIALSYPTMPMSDIGAMAGYAQGPSSSAQVSALFSLPHIQEFMLSQVKSGLVGTSLAALSTLSELSRSANSERVRLDATVDILDRLGAREQPKGSSGPTVAIKIG